MSAKDVIEAILEQRCEGYERHTAEAIIAALSNAGFTIERQVDVLRLIRQKEAVLGGDVCHFPEQHGRETTPKGEQRG